MCGIAGFTGPPERQLAERMGATLRHRGPDDAGLFVDEEAGLCLAHARLSIIDIAEGQQPMTTADGELTIVFNGEIYNHRELRAELEQAGHTFRTSHADTEVLLHGYRAWGTALQERLNGMWAFALYDRPRRRLWLSRDRFGQKPLYYALAGEQLIFASELTTVLAHPAAPRGWSVPGLQKYYGYGFIPAPHTVIAGIHKLPAGHHMLYDLGAGEVRVERYWQYRSEPFETLPAEPLAAWGEELRALLEQAVRRRLEAEVPLGIFLSGGIDSSCVARCAVAAHGQAVRTFAIGFEEPSFDESAYARQAAEHLGTEHHCATVTMAGMGELAQSIAAELDEPLGDSSILPTYVLSRETRRSVTVALGGDGGDELFAGYDPFRALRAARWYRRLVPRPVHGAIEALAGLLPSSAANMSLDFKLKRMLAGVGHEPRVWNPRWLAPLAPPEIAELLGEPCDPEALYSEAIELWERCPQENHVDRTIDFYLNLYMQDGILTKVDRASMRHGLEVRSPFLDIDLVNFVRRVPASWKLRGGTTKYLLKRALEPWLPRELLYRRKKGFGVPLAGWFKRWELPMEALPPCLDRAMAERRLAEHRAGRSNDKLFLWNTYALGAWAGAHTAE